MVYSFEILHIHCYYEWEKLDTTTHKHTNLAMRNASNGVLYPLKFNECLTEFRHHRHVTMKNKMAENIKRRQQKVNTYFFKYKKSIMENI